MEYSFRNHIKVVSIKGYQLTAHSPFRKDKNPSFSANENTGLWTDHGTGESGNYKSFMEKLGLETPNQNVYSASSGVKTKKTTNYFYNDENGNKLLKVTRVDSQTSGKKFLAYHWNGDSWASKRPQSLIPPMEYSVWKDTTSAIHLFEGEKCFTEAKSLFELTQGSHFATCLPFGSNKSSKNIAHYLKGKKVFLHPDQDKAGLDFCRNIASELEVKNIDYTLLTPLSKAPKSDFYDWAKDLEQQKSKPEEILQKFLHFIQNPKNHIKYDNLKTPSLSSLNNFEQKNIEWLLEKLIVRGDVNSIGGEPGVGKSSVVKSFIAGITKGVSPISGEVITTGDVLLISFEEDPNKVIRPKLEALGADLTKVHLPTRFEDIDSLCASENLFQAADQIKPILIVIDPIVAFRPEDTDMNSSSSVRKHIKVLQSWAKRYNAAVLFVSHFNKGSSGKATHRNSGSVDFIAGVRSALQVYEHPDNEDHRILVQSKSNYSKLCDHGFVYEITDSSVNWLGESPYTANQLATIDCERSKQDSCVEAIEFLFKALKDGPIEATQLFQLAAKDTIAKRTLEIVKPKFTTSQRIGLKGKQGGGHTLIHLKDDFRPSDLRTKELGGLKDECL